MFPQYYSNRLKYFTRQLCVFVVSKELTEMLVVFNITSYIKIYFIFKNKVFSKSPKSELQ